MSGFLVAFVGKADIGQEDSAKLSTLRAAFERKGMVGTRTLRVHDCVVSFFANDTHDPTQSLSEDADGWFCTYVGTLIYKGRVGKQATSAILSDLRQGARNCIDEALGNYCLLIKDDQRIRLVTDRAGLHHVYHDADLSLVSNSFIASACGASSRTLRTQEIREYVLFGATFGPRTLLEEVRLLGAETEVRFEQEGRKLVERGSVWQMGADEESHRSLDDRIEQAVAIARSYYNQIHSAFADKVTAALSGGYDSRLSLALLQRHGISPKLFVYGRPGSPDVSIASEICRSESLALDCVDRDSHPMLEPDEYWQNQESVFHGLDGLTQYGFACAPYEFSHRKQRVAGGFVAVNGGGGEIWRDFWKVPDRPMSAESFVKAYFAGRYSGLRQADKDSQEMLQGIALKLRELVEATRLEMDSATIQSLYARLRLRFWQGKNNSVDNHVGYAVTPFSECAFSVPAMWIPVRAKRDGWFERQIICRVSPRLASYPSAYGYDFKHGPGLVDRAKTRITCQLPNWLRRTRRARAIDYSRSYYHADRYVRARFGNEPLQVEKFFGLSELADPLAFSRALSVERMMRDEWLCR